MKRYLYQGACPLTGLNLTLPRTLQSEKAARRLMTELSTRSWSEGKMFGVLLAQTHSGETVVLRAFSGLLEGKRSRPGWVDFWVQPKETPLEIQTKARLQKLKETLKECCAAACFQDLLAHQTHWQQQRKRLDERLRQRKLARRKARDSGEISIETSQEESRSDSRELKELKRETREALAPLEKKVQSMQKKIRALKAERRSLSNALQAQMHQHFGQSAFRDMPCSLASLFPNGPPTGTGECCAPKLLAHARRHGLKPLAMAEFWWGPTLGDKHQGEFYPACSDRCQPMMGALLSTAEFCGEPHYIDDDLLIAEKPSGLLTVPGRQAWNQDSLLLRLRENYPELLPVHRLDLETSGLVIFARNPGSQSALQRQFENRVVRKRYRAVLTRDCHHDSGVLQQAIGTDPSRPGCYCLNPQGKPALTHFTRGNNKKELILSPVSGRSHQLRVHLAHGLGNPIAGDALYGNPSSAHRLMLHACAVELQQPSTGKPLSFESKGHGVSGHLN